MSIIAKLYSALFAPASHLEDMSKHIEDAERTTWNNANSNINAHSIDSVVHVTAEQKNIWDAKQDAIPDGTYDAYGSANLVNESLNAHADNGDIHVTLEDKQRWESKQDAIPNGTYDTYGAADIVDGNLTSHADNGDIHVTTTEKDTWNAKADLESYTNGLDGHHASNLPGGLQLRWGVFTDGSVTFAEPFTTECQSVTTNSNVESTSPHIVSNVTKTGCMIIAAGQGPYSGYYFAIGR